LVEERRGQLLLAKPVTMVKQNAANQGAKIPTGSRLGCRAVRFLDVKELGHLVEALSKLPAQALAF
jgi:hypothetical protein